MWVFLNSLVSSHFRFHIYGMSQCFSFSIWLTSLNMTLSVCVHAKSLQSCLTLCDLVNCSPPGSSVPGILQARILEWVAMHSFRGPSQSRDQTHISCSSCITGRFFTTEPPGKPMPLSRFIHIAASGIISFFLMAKKLCYLFLMLTSGNVNSPKI